MHPSAPADPAAFVLAPQLPLMSAQTCQYCHSAAALLSCPSCSSLLCQACDGVVHTACQTALTHERWPLCAACRTAAARAYCRNDQAALCPSCDQEMHSANMLVARHVRLPIEPLTGGGVEVHPESDTADTHTTANTAARVAVTPPAAPPAVSPPIVGGVEAEANAAFIPGLEDVGGVPAHPLMLPAASAGVDVGIDMSLVDDHGARGVPSMQMQQGSLLGVMGGAMALMDAGHVAPMAAPMADHSADPDLDPEDAEFQDWLVRYRYETGETMGNFDYASARRDRVQIAEEPVYETGETMGNFDYASARRDRVQIAEEPALPQQPGSPQVRDGPDHGQR